MLQQVNIMNSLKVSGVWKMANILKMQCAHLKCLNLRHLGCQAFRITYKIRHDNGIHIFLCPQRRPVSVLYTRNHGINWTNDSRNQSSSCLLNNGRNKNLKRKQHFLLSGNKLDREGCFEFDSAGFRTDCSRLHQRLLKQTFKFLAISRRQDFRCFSSKDNRPGKGKNKEAISEGTDSDSDTTDDSYDLDDPERDWDPEIDGKVGVASEVEKEGGAVKDWKDVQQHVPSLRIDAVLSGGLGISRRKVEDAFLSTRLRINGEKVTKKSRQVNEGDILDVILERNLQAKIDEDEGMSVMRVHVLEIGSEKTGKGRVLVLLRRWKNLKIKENK